MKLSTEVLVLASAITAFALPQGMATPPTAAVAADEPQPPKTIEKTLKQMAPPLKAVKTIDAKAVLRPEATRKLIRFGPFTLPATDPNMEHHEHGGAGAKGVATGAIPKTSEMVSKPMAIVMAEYLGNSMDPLGFGVLRSISNEICSDCTVLASQIDVVDEAGTRASIDSGVYLHHALAIDVATDRKVVSTTTNDWTQFCEGFEIMQSAMQSQIKNPQDTQIAVFSFGAVDEFKQFWTTKDGKFDSGYYLGANDKILLQAEMTNLSKGPKEVYLQFDVEYLPGKVGSPATTTFISTTKCNEPMVFLGKGGAGVHVGGNMTAVRDGTLLSARGHMHDGGSAMKLFINDKQVCESSAFYGTKAGEGNWTTISRMKDCQEPMKIKKGDKVRADAYYDTIAHPLRSSGGKDQEQMGLFAISFVPE